MLLFLCTNHFLSLYIQDASLISDEDETFRNTELCALDVKDRKTQNFLINFSFWTFFVIPLIVIVVLYVNICITIRCESKDPINRQSSRRTMTKHDANSRHRRNTVVKMLGNKNLTYLFTELKSYSRTVSTYFHFSVAVVTTFFICWLPFHIQRMSTIYVDFAHLNPSVMQLFTILFYVSGIFKSFFSYIISREIWWRHMIRSCDFGFTAEYLRK